MMSRKVLVDLLFLIDRRTRFYLSFVLNSSRWNGCMRGVSVFCAYVFPLQSFAKNPLFDCSNLDGHRVRAKLATVHPTQGRQPQGDCGGYSDNYGY